MIRINIGRVILASLALIMAAQDASAQRRSIRVDGGLNSSVRMGKLGSCPICSQT